MADKKIEKALYGPSTTEVALGAILGLIAGLLVACVYLVFKPVLQVKEMPKEPVRGAIYYIPGSELSAKARNWTTKQRQWVAGNNIEVVEDELNAWSAATFGAGAVKPPAGKDGAGGGGGGYDGIFNPGTPNFKIADGQMQIGFKCVLNWYGLTSEVIVLTTGTLKPSGDDFVFSPDTFYLGSCPLHLMPSLSTPLMKHLIGKKKVPDEIKSAWAKQTGAAIEGSTLKLTMR